MSRSILPRVLFGTCVFACTFAAQAQEDALGPPDVLQFPVQAAETAPRGVTGPFLRKAVEDAADLGLCEALMTEAGHQFPNGFRPGDCTASFTDQVRNQQGFIHWKGANARPLKCGDACVGRPFHAATRFVDRPNLREAMLYGHLDFEIDPPGPVNRDLTYFFEVHVQCKALNGARSGNIELRVDVGAPVIGDPGGFESVIDFIFLPARISDRIESFIRAQLQPVAGVNESGDPCRSIGVSHATNPLFDSMTYDPAPRPTFGRIGDLTGGVANLGDRAKVEFFGVTRKPLPPMAAPEHAQPGNPAAGYFLVYLNGAAAAFPVPLDMPADALVLPPEGGSVAFHYCRTISLQGWDRLQVLFANGLGGAVWSQFSRAETFGAGVPRRMTTGRGIVVPGLPGPPDPVTGRPRPAKPQPMMLREFELLYRITYLPEPVIGPADSRGGRPPIGSVTGVLDQPPVVSDGTPAPGPCREI